MIEHDLKSLTELGKSSNYDKVYNPQRLVVIERAPKRTVLGIEPTALPFYGFDLWTHYEVSWLNANGKPMVGVVEISYDCASLFMIESKSLKLYFNSFNFTRFAEAELLRQRIVADLQQVLQAEVRVLLTSLDATNLSLKSGFEAQNLDLQDITCEVYQVHPDFLQISAEVVSERLSSDLLKSNCLVTHQPDWGSILIDYTGPKICHQGLLRYLVSFRDHDEFHEQCIERIFIDILTRCKPQHLTVYARYTRRGGLDINPYRSTEKPEGLPLKIRLLRQ